MSQWRAGARITVEWGIKDSLIAYMAGDPSFGWEATGGAEFTLAAGARIPGVVEAGGALRLTGGLVIRAHEGALTVPLMCGRIEHSVLTIADPIDQGRMDLVLLRETLREASSVSFETRLTPVADVLFRYSYAPGTAFDDLVVRFGREEPEERAGRCESAA